MPFLVNKMDFLIVFWWFSLSKVSGWLLDILVRDSSFGLGVRMNLSLGPTRKSVRMAWKMLNKVAWPCLCLIFPLVPVRPSLVSLSPIILAVSSQKPRGSSPAKPAQQVNFRNYESELSPEYWFLCPQQYFSSVTRDIKGDLWTAFNTTELKWGNLQIARSKNIKLAEESLEWFETD